ncbi:MAG: hypothetical protein DWQ47_09135 [Acidobacteria bacterium]|nr:MAG: hypothetical protein DWQ32_17235 [Acidobacteriota bacterium]REJ98934.1 MAG: hypothetical protein DWQ38_12745 [Acidobacteriota bacterium]REK16346.1 MAG: hypothetical protein DWQ43_04945 [Acidobacteriota bacterium]REK44027.1 MAG: hypothetical protein DWQ47_09135 [Acidobacteriota bacterium]
MSSIAEAAPADWHPVRCAIPTFEVEFERSQAVFIGKVISIEKDADRKVFEFEIEKFWKGVEESKVVVTVSENPRFQAQFTKGGRFLVFAKADEEGGLFDGRCSRSKDLDRNPEGAEEDLDKLGPGKELEI